MKVLIVNSVCGVGSTGRICESIAKKVDTVGESVVAYGRGNYTGEVQTYKIGNDYDVLRHYVSSRLFSLHGRKSKKPTQNLINFIKDYNPDIINLHNIHGYYLNYELLFKFLKTTNIKIVWTLHDQWPFSPHAAYIEENIDGTLPTEIMNRNELNEYPKTFSYLFSKKNYQIKRELFSLIDKNQMIIVTPSKWLANLTKNTFLGKYKVKVINNGINLDTFKPMSFPKSKEKKKVLGVASVWDNRKGLDYLLEIAEKDKYDVTIVGKTNRDLSKHKLNYIQRTNNAVELAKFYSQADVFVNPTLADNFPTTNIESIACGTPVITFATGGSGECLDEEIGKVLAEKTVESLMNAIDETEKNRKVSEKCVEKSKEYNEKDKFGEYLSLFEHVLINK
ncbi:glycosyltransferase [Vagococcus lutrae]|uniref:glycosyltransferase n=1 Tax=Vagococcus lutrae TaxID=81947 RepID=UPI00200E5182|nr:glycosyltransferase [Vagococcus lutrae]UQF24041.1 glycosyltransferase [Vagococcus lutrae]UQF63868.1 glycosyltransferase [Vagococcus lutrae]